ncbi:Ig-like domain-containing protein [Ramlibacter sp. WS9]|uniref:Ig-like domain-containing protein n=1 Tax=Ramlibacter sp. WS9 TaxID=1882741 RepID=UPI001144BA13|nr:Ig-like domain-containing protein [Ramlibacter sp. WS9]ROZ69407.1 cadherin repeat domain-containing protein [Ramlibacter sp. WS9]
MINRIRTATIAENAAASTAIYTPAPADLLWQKLMALLPGMRVQYTLGGADAALFNISSTGVVTLKSPADYESRSSYNVEVIARSGAQTTVQPLNVLVRNLNDNAPVFTSGGTGFVAENASSSTLVYTAVATDADQPGGLIAYSLAGADAALLRITASGAVSLRASANFEAKSSYSFNVVASDGFHTTTRAVVVTVGNLDEFAPVFTSGGTGTVAENAAAGSVIYTSVAGDADTPTLSYSLGGADAALLDIDAAGAVTLKAADDYEVKGSYSFTVTASDGVHDTVQPVLVSVTNGAPTLAITSSVASLQDGETATITFTFSEDPGSSFIGSDIAVTGGMLGALSGSGLTRTATFTAVAGSGLSTGAKISVAGNTFTDLGGKAGEGDATLDIATVFNKVLFVGNSATFARVDPVMSYNTYDAVTNPDGVHDLTSPDQGGTFTNLTGSNLYEPHNWGGVPGLVDAFAAQLGLNYDVSLSTRNAATLKGHYTNSSPGGWDLRGNIASDEWDIVVLQDQTDEPLPSGSGSITFAAGSSTASLIITPNSDAVQEYDETFALTLASSANYRVGTSTAISTTILNDDPTAPVINPALSTVTLVASPGSVAEDGASNLIYTFTRTGSTASDLTVTFTAFRDGATSPSVSTTISASQDLEMYNTTTGALAVAGGAGTSPYRFTNGGGFATSANTGVNTTTGSVSFTSNTGTIVIKAGQTSASITLDPHVDANVELDESIKLTLTHPAASTDYNIGTSGPVSGTIVNDDFAAGVDTSLPNVTLGLSSATSVYESAGQSLVYTFTRSGSTAGALTVNFTEDGTATYFAGDAAHSDFSVTTTGATSASLTTTSGKNADISEFQKYATLIEDYIHTGTADSVTVPGTTIAANANASAETDVYLYATWARPDMIAGAWDMVTDKTLQPSGAYTGGTISQSSTQATAYYLTLEAMSTDLTNAYTNLANVNTDFKGVAPVSTAFMAAVLDGLAIRDPYTETSTSSVSTGKVDLWFDDKLHASKYGSYLSGLVLLETLTGIDAQALGADDPVAQDLGIDAATAAALQKVASATLGFNQSYHWTGPDAVTDLGGTNAAATLAAAGAFSFADGDYTTHTVSVQSEIGNLGTLAAVVRSDGHAGQVNWLYTADNQVVDPLLQTGEQHVDSFTVTLDDGHGHVSIETIGVNVYGGIEP